MAHEVEQMFAVGDAPWHGLGKRFEKAPAFGDILPAAGLDWTVSTVKLMTSDTSELVAAQAIRRDSDKSILGVTGPDYHPLQNAEALDTLRPFIEAGEATIETAGSLRSGQRVWFLARVKADPMDIVKGDPVAAFILLSNSHDGKLAVRLGFTPIRVVCANTLAMAHGDKASKLIRVLHTKQVKTSLDEVRKTMDAARGEFLATAEVFKKLAATACNPDDLKKYVRLVFKPQAATVDATTPIEEQVKTALTQPAEEKAEGDMVFAKILPLFEKGRGNDMKRVKGTMWAAYNAVTEYLTYERGVNGMTTADTRMDSVCFGQSAATNRRAIKVAQEMTGAV